MSDIMEFSNREEFREWLSGHCLSEAGMTGTESMAADSPAKGSQTSDPTGTDPRKENADVEALIALLDGCTQAGESRIKLDVVEGGGEVLSRKYHHGRCDVGSPWACGTAFDVLE